MTLAIGELAIACGVIVLVPPAMTTRDILACVTPQTRPAQQGCGTGV